MGISLKRLMPGIMAAAVAIVPATSWALSVTIEDLAGGGPTTVMDNGIGDSDARVGFIGAFGLNVGSFDISNLAVSALEEPNRSELSQTSLTVTGGSAAGLSIITTESFSGGSRAPDATSVLFSLGGSQLGGMLSGFANFDGTVTSTLSFDSATDGTDDFSDSVRSAAVLADPFDITTTILVGQALDTPTSFTATAIAAVPLPAAGLMLLAGLGSLGLMRRRRKAA